MALHTILIIGTSMAYAGHACLSREVIIQVSIVLNTCVLCTCVGSVESVLDVQQRAVETTESHTHQTGKGNVIHTRSLAFMRSKFMACHWYS